MKLSFDHLVHFATKPELAIEEFNQLGLHAFQGGNHENWGTYNSLSYFGLSYIEFLGIRDRKKAAEAAQFHDLTRQAMTLLPHKQGFNRIALRTDNIIEAAEHAQSLGFKIDGPIDGSRKRDDGVTLQWKMLFVEGDSKELLLPFFIQWNQSDEERTGDLHEKIHAHSIGKVEIKDLIIAVRDVRKTSEKWSSLLGVKANETLMDEKRQAAYTELPLKGGTLIFAAPIGDGFLSKQVEQHGEGPFLLRLKGEKSISKKEILGSYFEILPLI